MNKNKSKHAPIRNRHLLLMMLLALLMLLTVAAVVVTSVVILERTTREHREQIIVNTARMAAARIDGDKVDGCSPTGRMTPISPRRKNWRTSCTTLLISSISTSTRYGKTDATSSSISTRWMRRPASLWRATRSAT